MYKWVLALVFVVAAVSSASAAIGSSEANRLASAAKVVQEIHDTIPADLWTRARCAAVIPDLKKAAFIFGGEYGKGVMSCRAGDQWSAPVFMQMAKGSWGFQAGAEEVDVVLLVMNESGVEKLLRNKVNLGADASVAAGPVGRQGHVGTDAALTAEIISYSRAQGLFAGINLSGGVLRPDEDSNKAVYGSRATPRTILASREISAPVEAQTFLRALKAQGATPATGQTTTAPAPPRTTISSATDEDLRARILDMQQSLDRMLADTTPAPVGTGGTTAARDTVTIERARLVQLRQQLDAILAALNRR